MAPSREGGGGKSHFIKFPLAQNKNVFRQRISLLALKLQRKKKEGGGQLGNEGGAEIARQCSDSGLQEVVLVRNE